MSGRRVLLYFSWIREAEIAIELGLLEDRFPALFEFRRALWPLAEALAEEATYEQDVSGFLDHVVLNDFGRFRQVVSEASGHEVRLIERGDTWNSQRPIDASLLTQVDTLIIVSLDHRRESRCVEPQRTEIEAIQRFVSEPGKCVIVCPHHDVGSEADVKVREGELLHHGDRLVPSRQRLGGYARALLEAFEIPVMNQFALSPGRAEDGSPAPLILDRASDRFGVLRGVTTFNLHPHLPHFALNRAADARTSVLARQSFNQSVPPHPRFDGASGLFNAFVQHDLGAERGVVYICDATLWSSAFGGNTSLEALWRNIARIP